MVGNPTNPTSTLHHAEALAGLARPGRVLVVDEAFMDAVPGESQSLACAAEIPGLIVVRSFTKTWGLAGLRIGYVLAAPDLIDALGAVQHAWPVSAPALAACVATCDVRALAEAGAWARELTRVRADFVAELEDLPGVEVVGLPGERVVRAAPGPQRPQACDGLLHRYGLAVRRGETFPGAGPDVDAGRRPRSGHHRRLPGRALARPPAAGRPAARAPTGPDMTDLRPGDDAALYDVIAGRRDVRTGFTGPTRSPTMLR